MTVPADSSHNTINTSKTEDFKLYTIYSPAYHKDGITRATKEVVMENKKNFNSQATE